MGDLLESTYAVNSTQAGIPSKNQGIKAATKRGVSVQSGKGNGRRTPVTEIPPAPTKKRGTSRTPRTPVKRKAALVTDDEQEDPLSPLSTQKDDVSGLGQFEDSDKFFQLLGGSRSETFDCQLNLRIARRYGSQLIRSPWPDQIEDQVPRSLGSFNEGISWNGPTRS